jgi:hypothetical protein
MRFRDLDGRLREFFHELRAAEQPVLLAVEEDDHRR